MSANRDLLLALEDAPQRRRYDASKANLGVILDTLHEAGLTISAVTGITITPQYDLAADVVNLQAQGDFVYLDNEDAVVPIHLDITVSA